MGRVLAPQGLRGEVRVEVLTDFRERFDPGSCLFIEGRPVVVERSRWQGKAFIVKFDAIADRTAAEGLRGREITAAPLEDALEEGTYYRDDLIGLEVVGVSGEALGKLTDILATGSNDVYVVRGPKGELLLPATDDVIREVDVPGERMVVDVIEGLEWQPASGRRRSAPVSRRTRPRPPPASG